jgi:hypothetical protein
MKRKSNCNFIIPISAHLMIVMGCRPSAIANETATVQGDGKASTAHRLRSGGARAAALHTTRGR